MKNIQGTALITGASSGIGHELAKYFAEQKHNLVLVARNREQLEKLADELQKEHGISALVLNKDLSSATAAQELFHEIESRNIKVDFLVNNAGFGMNELFHKMPLNHVLDMIQVNISALTQLTHLFLHDMIARNAGKVLNIASTAAFMPGPTQAVYFATKAYVLHFSEAIAHELQGTKVSVTAYCPGPTHTGFAKRARMTDSPLFKLNVMSARTVAEDAYRTMMQGKSLAIAGWSNRLMIFSTRFSPRWLVALITRKMTDGRAAV